MAAKKKAKKKPAARSRKVVQKKKPVNAKKAKKAKKTQAKSIRKPVKKSSRRSAVAAGSKAHSAAASVAVAAETHAHSWRRAKYNTLQEFWPFYLHEHRFSSNRVLHFMGSTLALALLGVAVGTANSWLLIPAVVSGYAFAWVGHFFIEKNRPATFTYPLKSLISDWRMWYCTLSGQIPREFQKYGLHSK
jgi:hypothetical protein